MPKHCIVAGLYHEGKHGLVGFLSDIGISVFETGEKQRDAFTKLWWQFLARWQFFSKPSQQL
jgi:hypothetical protein